MSGKYTPEQREKLVSELKVTMDKTLKELGKRLKTVDIHDDTEMFEFGKQMQTVGTLITDISKALVKDSSVTLN